MFLNHMESTPRFYSLYLKAPTHAKRCFYDLKGPSTIQTWGVSYCVALPFTWKSMYLKAKEELWKLKYFTMQKYDLQKIL
jgi:hypothetical protein